MFEIFLILTLFSLALGQECADFENSGFFCVDSRLCIEGNIDQSGQNVLSVRQAEEPSLPSPETRSQALRSRCPEVSETCCYYGEGLGLQYFKTEQPASRSSCGQHNEGGVEGFVSNERKKLGFGEFPHICVILSRLIVDGKRKKQYEGAASLISPRVLLTAAHIVDDFGDDELEIRCGEWDSSTRDEPLQHQTRTPEKVLIYPEANSENLHNDFALIFVNEEFSISQHISPGNICLQGFIFFYRSPVEAML
ncbi:serine proteinase stubble [Eurytemora carolleeae]|uniref:serine proteinase stubble n=1 Tax=Eurytemora carolleeae TaxID=1294199 RepID=UPI000C77820D|nr:serine proteinase stubble [Eurytemora carolleeae]|eukprot:XP_023334918.1 serine proteinase stubble-like [Eurytemora affinis]